MRARTPALLVAAVLLAASGACSSSGESVGDTATTTTADTVTFGFTVTALDGPAFTGDNCDMGVVHYEVQTSSGSPLAEGVLTERPESDAFQCRIYESVQIPPSDVYDVVVSGSDPDPSDIDGGNWEAEDVVEADSAGGGGVSIFIGEDGAVAQ